MHIYLLKLQTNLMHNKRIRKNVLPNQDRAIISRAVLLITNEFYRETNLNDFHIRVQQIYISQNTPKYTFIGKKTHDKFYRFFKWSIL